MNYKEISEKYPKAFESLKLFICGIYFEQDTIFRFNEIGGGGLIIENIKIVDSGGSKYVANFYDFNDRELYDFFDSKGIIISNMGDRFKFFWWSILDPKHQCNSDLDNKFHSRAESETAAFTKAFSILEQQL